MQVVKIQFIFDYLVVNITQSIQHITLLVDFIFQDWNWLDSTKANPIQRKVKVITDLGS
jgi:hypothetical protein